MKQVSWKRLDVHKPFTGNNISWFNLLSEQADMVLYNGSCDGLSRLHQHLATTAPSTPIHALLPGSLRLRKLRRFNNMEWRSLSHSQIGGCTNGKFWLGSSSALRTTALAGPKYCPSTLGDILEFAPKNIRVESAYPPLQTERSSKVERLVSTTPTFINNGLLDWKLAQSQPWVLTTTPFTSTGWCTRPISCKEWARIFDAPVAFEKRLHSAEGSLLSLEHTLLSSTPAKVIQHSLWLLGLYNVSDGGEKFSFFHQLTQPTFSLDQNENLVRDYDQFAGNEEELAAAHREAVKHDDAEVPVYIWNDRLVETYPNPDSLKGISRQKIDEALDTLRGFALKVWKRKVRRSFINYLHLTWPAEYEIVQAGRVQKKEEKLKRATEFWKDYEAGLDCLDYVGRCSWWEWNGGSRLLFWRWTEEFKKFARDGLPVLWLDKGKPTAKKAQPQVPDPFTKERMREKVSKVRKKRYVGEGFVRSLIYFFAVPKGLSDIRMVYDGTASGFNERIWVPNFGLPTCETLLRGTEPGSWMVDLDIGDMFLNFMLDELAREYIGIDLSTLFEDEIGEGRFTLWERWNRCAMGLKCSPYHAIRAMLFAIEFLKGHPSDENNPFKFDKVKLNLPGSEFYNPSKPWFTVLDKGGHLASILATYVDDERIHANSKDKAWRAAHQIASRETYLGIQDAARKRRPPTQVAGAWAGSIIRTNEEEVGVVVSEERWNKTKAIISRIYKELQKPTVIELDTKELLSDRGFLIYICRTYRTFTPFLKGMHLTIDGWRHDRDDDGWKLATNHISDKSNKIPCKLKELPQYPKMVKPVPRFGDDIKALMELTKSEKPPVMIKTTPKLYIVRYGFGDASGGGFGSTLEERGKVEVLAGTWNEKGSKRSSNFRELSNFVIRLEAEAAAGKLKGAELFFFTDNDAAQSCYHNGTSSSKLLFNLVLRLKKLELREGLRLHIIHVSGTRMIAQGTDGVSRGNMMEGVLTGRKMLSYVPIHLSAFEREEKLLHWVRIWCGDNAILPLEPVEWLWEGQGLGRDKIPNCDGMLFPERSKRRIFLWSPPPCIAEVALEFLRESVHRRPDAFHIIVIPKLMTYAWRKILLKTCDLSFYLDVGSDSWSSDMHESLLFGLYLPLLHCFPWTLRKSGSVLEMERLLSSLPKTEAGTKGALLRKFLLFTRRLQSMPERMVWDLLQKKRCG